jgi:ketosteroid isomerase-like protein
MEQENAEIVRKPLGVRERSRRTLDQRLSLRFPRLAAAFLHRILKLPPSSRLRQAALRRGVRLSLEAYNRRDLDAVVIGWSDEFEYHPDANWVKAGIMKPCYRGFDDYRKYVAAGDEVWGGENHLKPTELIDLGERIVVLADGRMRGQASGIPLVESFALVTTIQDGRFVHHQEYYDHAAALEVVGLSE